MECRINLIGNFQCALCGGPGEACCGAQGVDVVQTCRDEGCCIGSTCWAENGPFGTLALGQCQAGKCTGCGELGQPRCGGLGVPSCQQEGLYCDERVPAGGSGGGPNGSAGSIGVGAAGFGNQPLEYETECVACGSPGEPCCSGKIGDAGGCCVRDSDFSHPQRCVAAGDTCTNGAACQAGSCGACGKDGQPCCVPAGGDAGSRFCSGSFTECITNPEQLTACHACGAPGTQACSEGRCESGVLLPNSGGICK